jgi:hypothetical protein
MSSTVAILNTPRAGGHNLIDTVVLYRYRYLTGPTLRGFAAKNRFSAQSPAQVIFLSAELS